MNEPARSRYAGRAAGGVIAATYIYFLVFAEFAMLGLAQPFAAEGWGQRTVMGALGCGGVVGSVLAALNYRTARFRRALAGGLGACALTAGWALAAKHGGSFTLAAAGVGLALGWLTVTLVTGLRLTVASARLGLVCGVGTGLAYALCNIPLVFTASPAAQTWLAIAVALLGIALVPLIDLRETLAAAQPVEMRGQALRWVSVLLALVWLDSSAFYIIQHTAAFKVATWTGGWRLASNAGMHLVAAFLAGWSLDRGYAAWLLGLSGGLLVAACLMLQDAGPTSLVSIFYAAGVSLYSTALVFYPARCGNAWLAAGVYAVAGWGGSALGIGMAQDLQRIPGWFLALTTVVLAAALAGRARAGAVLSMATILLLNTPTPLLAADDNTSILLGREVYIAEGCMHCHSQYVRPHQASDLERWGPATPLPVVRAETPPLPGNRRQGPDLAAVGNRRSPDWERLHLQHPRALVPGSRMPDYDYLFRGDGKRGEALVAYLASLGAETLAARLAATAAWRPKPEAGIAIEPQRGARLFAHWCIACHGVTGHGNGPLAVQLKVQPPNWAVETWRHVPAGETDVEGVLARIIKFGLPGSPMAGHEYFSDADTLALARWVQSLRPKPPLPP